MQGGTKPIKLPQDVMCGATCAMAILPACGPWCMLDSPVVPIIDLAAAATAGYLVNVQSHTSNTPT